MARSANPAPDADALELADTLARRLLELAAPVTLDVARRDADLQAIYRLRFAVASERGWLDATETGDGLERDAYDADAVHIGAWDGGELVGTQRIILPAPGRTLPLEHAFGLEVEPRGQVVHADRIAIARHRRGDRRHLLLSALMARSWLEWRSRGFHHCTGVVTQPILRFYREAGLEVEILGDARPYQGELRFPARFDVLGTAARLSAQWGVPGPSAPTPRRRAGARITALPGPRAVSETATPIRNGSEER